MENSFRHGSLFLWLAMVICLLCVPRSVYAQAWDGDGDIKVYAGYANVGAVLDPVLEGVDVGRGQGMGGDSEDGVADESVQSPPVGRVVG